MNLEYVLWISGMIGTIAYAVELVSTNYEFTHRSPILKAINYN